MPPPPPPRIAPPAATVHKTSIFLLLLRSSGDTHPNPGPATSVQCGLCERAVSSHEGVCCDECDMWHHRSCTMCTKVNRSNGQWYCCYKCETLNLSSFTLRSNEISLSYHEPINYEKSTFPQSPSMDLSIHSKQAALSQTLKHPAQTVTGINQSRIHNRGTKSHQTHHSLQYVM